LPEQQPAGTELVLVVDDNEKNSKLVCDVLQFAGMRTLSAATALAGMALASEHLPDLVLMDLRLPDLDGAEAARRLKGAERTRCIPLVAMSALREQDSGVWLSGADFDGYIEKPIDVGELPEQVRRYCASG
jgi:two-component system, cell cycle response regulator DivK